MQIYWNKRKRLHKKRVQLPQDWFGTPTWPLFYCFETPIWPQWRHVKTLYWLRNLLIFPFYSKWKSGQLVLSVHFELQVDNPWPNWRKFGQVTFLSVSYSKNCVCEFWFLLFVFPSYINIIFFTGITNGLSSLTSSAHNEWTKALDEDLRQVLLSNM